MATGKLWKRTDFYFLYGDEMEKKKEMWNLKDALEQLYEGPQPRMVLENVPDYTHLLGTEDDDTGFILAVSGRWSLKRIPNGELYISGAVRRGEQSSPAKQMTCYEVTTEQLRQKDTYTMRDHISQKNWMTDRDEDDIDNLMRVADFIQLGAGNSK